MRSAVIVAPGGVFDLNGTNETIGSLNGGGTVLLGSATLTLGGNGSPMVFDGVISGSGGLTMSGAGMLTPRWREQFHRRVERRRGNARARQRPRRRRAACSA